MIFVGRKKESRKIAKALALNRNIIITGKFGIGRTVLARQIAEQSENQRRFLFIDFSETPRKMSELLMRQMGFPREFLRTGLKMGYKSMRWRIAVSSSHSKNQIVIVFDNITRFTSQRNIFLRNLMEEGHFQFIAICENFLPAKEFALLKAQLFPVETILLQRLSKEESTEYIRLTSEKYRLNWTQSHIDALAELACGYPPSLSEMIKAAAKNPLT